MKSKRKEKLKQKEDIEFHYEMNIMRKCLINWYLYSKALSISKNYTKIALMKHREIYAKEGCYLIYLHHEKEMEKDIQLFINNEKKRVEYNAHQYALAIKYFKLWKMKSISKMKKYINNNNNNCKYIQPNVISSEYRKVIRNEPILDRNYDNNNICNADHPFDFHPTIKYNPNPIILNAYKTKKYTRLPKRNIENEIEEDNRIIYGKMDEEDRKTLLMSWKNKIDRVFILYVYIIY